MSEKRFEYDKCTGIKDLSIDENNDQFLYPTQIVDLLNELNDENKELKEENEQLKAKVKRLQDIATRTEAEKEEYADLYCKCENELIKNGRRCDGV